MKFLRMLSLPVLPMFFVGFSQAQTMTPLQVQFCDQVKQLADGYMASKRQGYTLEESYLAIESSNEKPAAKQLARNIARETYNYKGNPDTIGDDFKKMCTDAAQG